MELIEQLLKVSASEEHDVKSKIESEESVEFAPILVSEEWALMTATETAKHYETTKMGGQIEAESFLAVDLAKESGAVEIYPHEKVQSLLPRSVAKPQLKTINGLNTNKDVETSNQGQNASKEVKAAKRSPEALHNTKKRKFDLEMSLKRPLSYKPYSGNHHLKMYRIYSIGPLKPFKS